MVRYSFLRLSRTRATERRRGNRSCKLDRLASTSRRSNIAEARNNNGLYAISAICPRRRHGSEPTRTPYSRRRSRRNLGHEVCFCAKDYSPHHLYVRCDTLLHQQHLFFLRTNAAMAEKRRRQD